MGARRAPDWPAMMPRTLAALYCGLTGQRLRSGTSPSGRLPMPVILAGKESWSRVQIDECLDRLTGARVPDWRASSNLYNAG